MTQYTSYQTPLSSRYASPEMSYLFSAQYKYSTWRRLWVALAKAEKKLGLPITDAQIQSLTAQIEKIDFDRAAAHENTTHHDVMAHVHAYAEACPEAKGILHLGATSCFLTDNTDQIQMREALNILKGKLVQAIRHLTSFAKTHASLPCLSYTHFQAAQPTTVGKRACLWLQEWLMDLNDLEDKLNAFRFLGAKGATGTQASFLTLFGGAGEKVKQLDQLIAQEMGFKDQLLISGQTYSRKQEMRLFSVLSGVAASCHKFATDIRLLSHLKEIEEPHAPTQVGSSAMPYKRNPIYCERICGLARFLLSLAENPAYTASTQWLERTLDDSANRRLAIPEAFLTADAILNLLIYITSGLAIHPKMISKHLQEEIPFMATENILMEVVKRGKDRQEAHEKLRRHSFAASQNLKEGRQGDLLERICQDPFFGLSEVDLKPLIEVEKFIGRAKEQVEEFLDLEVYPLLKRYETLPSQAPLPPL